MTSPQSIVAADRRHPLWLVKRSTRISGTVNVCYSATARYFLISCSLVAQSISSESKAFLSLLDSSKEFGKSLKLIFSMKKTVDLIVQKMPK